MQVSATQQTRRALGTYLETIKADHTNFASLRAIFEEHDKLAGELDARILNLEQEVSDLDKQIDVERKNPETNNQKQLSRKISITVLAQKAGEVTINVKYRQYLFIVFMLDDLIFQSQSSKEQIGNRYMRSRQIPGPKTSL
jgi:hypothetical protein